MNVFRPPYAASMLALLAIAGCAAPGPDSVKAAKEVNAVQPPPVSREASTFIVEMTDARLMDYQEGKLATERSGVPAIVAYGRLMMRDQTQLLMQLRELAASSGVAVPTEIGADKRDGLKNLLEASPERFDAKFISSIRIDHERDVGEFRKATKFEDPAVQAFAARNLPTIESHLEGVKQLDQVY